MILFNIYRRTEVERCFIQRFDCDTVDEAFNDRALIIRSIDFDWRNYDVEWGHILAYWRFLNSLICQRFIVDDDLESIE